MPFSNERSISLSGDEDEIINCVSFFLMEIGQVRNKTFLLYMYIWSLEKRRGNLQVIGSVEYKLPITFRV